MAGGGNDPFGDIARGGRTAWKTIQWGYNFGRGIRARRLGREAAAEYGHDVGEAVEVAVRNGRNPEPILEKAREARRERQERERLLANPPPLHGSAAWATPAQMKPFLKPREAFDTPSSLLLGAVDAPPDDPVGGTRFVHWDGDGHLLTLAPTRSGKALTTIIPNLLRYRGSAVVLDPKGELYEATSAWRARHVGPVFRWAPFDEQPDGRFPRHGFNPLAAVKTEQDARTLAEQMFPRDPRATEFFTEDAVAFMTALMLFVKDEAPPSLRNLATVHKTASEPLPLFQKTVKRMMRSRLPSVAATGANVAGKSGDRGLPNLRDTLHSKLARWGAPALLDSFKHHDFDFAALKDAPATVYLDVPFDLMEPYAPVLRVILKAALDGMLHNKQTPEIPVLFVLDEFLQLGPFTAFRNAIRTHAGAGVRLWFFLQDLAGLEEHYPDGWKPFFNCAVRQFFGTNDPFTGELVGRYLGSQTVAYRSTNAGANVSASSGGDNGSSGVSISSGESVQFLGRPLLTPDEIMAELSGWKGNGWRGSILDISGARPFKAQLSVVNNSPSCRDRLGAYTLLSE